MPDQVKIQILSPFNCGSNLLVKILQSLFKIDKLEEEGSAYIWKHTTEYSHFQKIDKNAITFIMVRNPLYWFKSIQNVPYEIKLEGDSRNMLDKQVRQKACNKNGKIHSIIGDHKNIIQLWNHYYRNYQQLKKERPGKTMFIKYEDLIFKPIEVVRRLSERIPFRNDIDKNNLLSLTENIIKEPAKNNRKCKNHKQALRANTNSYLKFEYSNRDIIKVNNNIDTDLIKELGYNLNIDKSLSLLTTQDIAYLSRKVGKILNPFTKLKPIKTKCYQLKTKCYQLKTKCYQLKEKLKKH